jgi:hypothetical protein
MRSRRPPRSENQRPSPGLWSRLRPGISIPRYSCCDLQSFAGVDVDNFKRRAATLAEIGSTADYSARATALVPIVDLANAETKRFRRTNSLHSVIVEIHAAISLAFSLTTKSTGRSISRAISSGVQ